jgi:multiple sugar transport system ATP-binding protein
MANVTLEHISKVYENGVRAVDDFSLEVADGEFMVLVGPSGCGKTTALRMIAGLEEITEGTLRIGGRVVNSVSPKDRDIAMVFQNYALYPHMTVAENIGFALKLSKHPKEEVRAKVEQAAAILGLTDYLDKKPSQLSGGQRQRVAMGRALVREPAVFLMDEPLSNLDAKLRVQMRTEISRIQRRLNVATIYVTHDQTEAMTMGDRVAVMRGGTVQQCDVPQALYDEPVNLFVASFIGSPAMNLYEATMSADGSELLLGDQHLELPRSLDETKSSLAAYFGKNVVVGIRPEHLHDGATIDEIPPGHALEGEVELVEALGSDRLVHFHLDAHRLQGNAHGVTDGGDLAAEGLDAGELGATAMHVGIARVDPTSQIRVGERARFAVDVALMHLFDPTSGEAIGRSVRSPANVTASEPASAV